MLRFTPVLAAFLVVGCVADEQTPPTRRVGAHALLWNGMAASRADEGQAALQIYDVPADCGMVRRREVPVDAKLRVDIYPKQWVAGSAEAELYPQALEGGHDAGLGYSVIRVHVDTGVLEHPAFEVLAAPTADGSHGRVRLDMRIELLREPATPENPHDVVRTDVISGELDVEVCGDWAEPKPFR